MQDMLQAFEHVFDHFVETMHYMVKIFCHSTFIAD